MRSRVSDWLRTCLDGPEVPDAVRAQLVGYLYPPSFRIATSFVASALNGVFLAWTMWSLLPLGWMAVALGLCAFRALDWWHYRRDPTRFTPAQWARRFTLRFLPFGIWWGTTAAVLLVTDDPMVKVLAVVAAAAMSAGMACTYPGHPPAVTAFSLPVLGGFLVGGILLGGRFGAAITIIQIILILNYVVIVREFFRSTVKALLLQHEKTALADKLEQARAELQREARAKSAFLANISHEVRTPLNGIIGTNALLGMTDLDERQRRYNETVRHSAENLLAILNDMLDFSKLEAGRFQLDRVAFDPEQLVEDAVELVAPRVQAKGIELVVRVDPPVRRTLIGDPVRIRQILLNLLSNAVKFTERGLVAVTLTGAPGEGDSVALRLEVRDTGPGIDPEARARLFHSFEQADGSITRRYGGTGLGLAICKELVQLMDGRIEVESEKGAGSTFRVELALPLAEAGTRRPEPQGLSGLGALLVAPPGLVRDQHERLLAEAGIAVATADTLESTDDLPAGLDVLLVDGRLARPLDRLLTARDHPLARTRCILIAELGQDALPEDGAAGFQAIVRKPVRRRELLRALATSVARHGVDGEADGRTVPPEDGERRILVVDDHPVNREMASFLLAGAGYRVDTAVNGLEAVRQAESIAYDLVLMDIQMPLLDGIQATAAIRALGGGRGRIQVIALTSNALGGDRESYLAAGMDDYLCKPIDPKRLLATVRSRLAAVG